MTIINFPSPKPEIIDSITYDIEAIEKQFEALLKPQLVTFQQSVDWLFWTCVEILKVWGDITGLGYNLITILIFILLQPALIVLFFTLWLSERTKRGGYHG